MPRAGDLADVDVVIVGIPLEAATTDRPGGALGPPAIRAASGLLRPYHPALHVDVFGELAAADAGDLATPDALDEVLGGGAAALVLGGDHSVRLAELRAHARAAGSPVGVVVLDAHVHQLAWREAVGEGLVAPERSVLAGMRGPLEAAGDLDDLRDAGFDVITGDELRAIGPGDFSARARQRLADGPALLSFDVDVVDPGFAPATATPEVAGLLPHEALVLLRSLAGVSFRGYDVLGVAPPYDGPGQTTALLAANVAYELLALSAIMRA